MTVFTNDEIERLRSKFLGTPTHRIPEIYWIATDESASDERKRIEDWVSSYVPDNAKTKFAGDLRSKNFRATYHELMVADQLSQLGFKVDYHKQLQNGQTPDWYVHSKGDVPAFYVEVFTPSPPQLRVKHEQQWTDLAYAVEKLLSGIGLSIEVESDCPPPNERQIKKIAQKVKRWLEIKTPKLEDSLALHNTSYEELTGDEADWGNTIKFIVWEVFKNDEEPTGWCNDPAHAYWVDTNSLKNKLHSKVRKYRDALKSIETPLVVCLIPHPNSLLLGKLGYRIIEKALFGQTGLEIIYGKGQKSVNLGDGIFNGKRLADPTLSTVIWMSSVYLWDSSDNNPVRIPFGVYPNPNALYPIPLHALNFT